MSPLTEFIVWLTGGRPISLEGLSLEVVYLFPLIMGVFNDRFKSRERSLEAQAQWLLLLALAPVVYGWTLSLFRHIILLEPIIPALTTTILGGYSSFVRLRRLYIEGWIR